jgi:hypothetical protein
MSNIEPADNMGPGGNNNNAASFQPPVDVGASSGGQGPGGNSNNAIPFDEVGFNYNPYQTNRWWDSAQYGMNAADVFMVEDNTGGMADEYKQYLYDSVRQGWGGDTDLEKQRQGWEINKRGLRPWLKERAQAWNVSNGFGPSGGSGMSAADQAKAKEERIVAAEASIRNQLGVFGIAMTPDGMRGIATQAVDNNWSQDKLQDILLQANDWATTQAGALTAGITDVRNIASQYLMPVSEETARSLSMRVASNELDLGGIRSLFTAQARKEYGFLSEELDQGITPADYFAPMRDVAADTLEISANTMNLMDDNVRRMFTTANEDGTMRGASLSEVKMSARKDSRYAKTQGAQDRIAAMGSALAQSFGGQ